jgi:hypothetical protein
MPSHAGRPDPLRATRGEVLIASRSERPGDVSRVVRAVIVPPLLDILLEEIIPGAGGEA